MANVLNITSAHDKSRICLHGAMGVAFNDPVSADFSVRLFTISNEVFNISSSFGNFVGITGAPVPQFSFGGKPGLYVEFMFDGASNSWYMVANNFVNNGSGGGGSGPSEVFFPDSSILTPTSLDGSLGNVFVITLTANYAIPRITNPQPGETYLLILVQDMAGNHTVTVDKTYKFPNNVAPTPSTAGSAIDIVEATYSSSGFFYSTYRNGYTITGIARIGATKYDTVAQATVAAQTGDTIYVTRSGQMSECIGAFDKDVNVVIAGDPSINGVPTLRVDNTVRLAHQKGIIDVEYGDVLIRDIGLSGSRTPDYSGAGVRHNPNVRHLRLERAVLTNNENGVLCGVLAAANQVTTGYTIELIDCNFDKNGQGADGQSHNIYLQHYNRVYALRSRFTNAAYGHDFKTRADFVLMDRVYCRGAGSRELDVPDGGVIHAVNCSFIMDPKSGQNNLVGITHESVLNPKREYIFRNCLFQNNSGGNYSETFLHQLIGTDTVIFVDCVFVTGAPDKCVIASPFRLIYTGGPIGPEGWDQSNRGVFPPKGGNYNPTGGNSAWPANQQPAIEYIPDPTLDVFPPTGSSATPSVRPEAQGPDTVAPVVSLIGSSNSISAAGPVTLTANASDNVGVTKVEFYRESQLMASDTTSPYTATVNFTSADNGQVNFTAKAYDAAGNVGSSNVVTVTVNILPPPQTYPFSIDNATTGEYNAAIAAAAMGSKRMAGANAIAAAMQPYSLNIYQESTLVLPFTFSGNMTVADNGTDVTVSTGSPEPVDPLVAADINGGTWHFELVGGANNSRIISGSVGPVGSGKLIEISDSPAPGVGISVSYSLVVPRAVDGLT